MLFFIAGTQLVPLAMKNITILILLFVSFCVYSQRGLPSNANTDGGQERDSISTGLTDNAQMVTPDIEGAASASQGQSIANRLLKKANLYYEKMWYAEAAPIFEQLLKEYPQKQTVETLQKVGDSYYFISDMEKANIWYEKMFSQYRKNMGEEAFFKYVHSLKGVGKYAKARRIMNLIDKKVSGVDDPEMLKAMALDVKKNITLKNLDINSKYSDFSPTFYKKDQLVFSSSRDSSYLFTRTYLWNREPFLDFYVGNIDAITNGSGGKIEKMPKALNSRYHEAGAAFTADGTTIYFTRNNSKGRKLKRDVKGVNNLKLYKAKMVKGKWSEAKELPFNDNSYSVGHPALSPDGKKLYFVSDMPGGYGKTDIYVVDVLGNDQYSEPKNLGRTVNTKSKEVFPFITDNTLYFSSDRSFGFGGLDVYSAKYERELFEIAINIGQPINSKNDDFSYIVNEDSKTGYFASNRDGGKGNDDIYAFEEFVIEEDEHSAIVGVIVGETSGETVAMATVQLLDSASQIIATVETDEHGGFEFKNLEYNTRYTLRTEKTNFEEKIVVVDTEEKSQVSINVLLPDEKKPAFERGAIYFDFDRHQLPEGAKEKLDELVQLWDDFPDMVVKIASHTDSRGAKAYNQFLSQKRADATKAYLLSKGVKEHHIESAIGYGEEQPINDCIDGVRCPEDLHRSNRRSEFIITDY